MQEADYQDHCNRQKPESHRLKRHILLHLHHIGAQLRLLLCECLNPSMLLLQHPHNLTQKLRLILFRQILQIRKLNYLTVTSSPS